LELPASAATSVELPTGAYGELILDSPSTFSGTVEAFYNDDTVILDGVIGNAASLSFSGNQAGGTLYVTEGGGTVASFALIPQLGGVAGYGSAVFTATPNVADNNTTITVSGASGLECFAAGTRILTERGEVEVERLREGDRVVTMLAGGTAPVVWIGRRHVWPRRHTSPETVQPVVVQPGAFGPGRPRRALRMSPDHAVYVDGILIPVGLLINGRGIAQEDVAEVTYYHVELTEHEVLYAEGMSCESYLATGDASGFDNNGGAVALHPVFAPAAIWETMGCAPLIRHGARLDAVRERLAAVTRPARSSRRPRPASSA